MTLWAKNSSGDINALFNPDSSSPSEGDMRGAYGSIPADDRVYFFTHAYVPGDGYTFGYRFAVSDGTQEGTRTWWTEDMEYSMNTNWSNQQNHYTYSNRLLFSQKSSDYWWITNGTAASTERLKDDGEPIWSPDNPLPTKFSAGANGFWFTGSQNIYYTSDTSYIPERIEADVRAIDNLQEINGSLWFSACPDGEFTNCQGVWRISPDDE